MATNLLRPYLHSSSITRRSAVICPGGLFSHTLRPPLPSISPIPFSYHSFFSSSSYSSSSLPPRRSDPSFPPFSGRSQNSLPPPTIVRVVNVPPPPPPPRSFFRRFFRYSFAFLFGSTAYIYYVNRCADRISEEISKKDRDNLLSSPLIKKEMERLKFLADHEGDSNAAFDYVCYLLEGYKSAFDLKKKEGEEKDGGKSMIDWTLPPHVTKEIDEIFNTNNILFYLLKAANAQHSGAQSLLMILGTNDRQQQAVGLGLFEGYCSEQLEKHQQDPSHPLPLNALYILSVFFDQFVSNPNKHDHYLKLAAHHGHPLAALSYAALLLSGDMGDHSDQNAYSCLVKAVNSGLPALRIKLAQFYLNGMGGVEQNFHEGINQLEIAMKEKVPEAFFLMALLHIDGRIIKRDVFKAVEYLEEASSISMNDANAHCMLGYMYLIGQGKPLDRRKAYLHFKTAESELSPRAMFYLAKYFRNEERLNYLSALHQQLVAVWLLEDIVDNADLQGEAHSILHTYIGAELLDADR